MRDQATNQAILSKNTIIKKCSSHDRRLDLSWKTFFEVRRNCGRIDSLIINNIAHRSRHEIRARLGVTSESSFNNSQGIQTSGSGGAEAAEMGAEGLAGQGGGLLGSSAKVSDPAAQSPVQKQEMPARGSSGGTG